MTTSSQVRRWAEAEARSAGGLGALAHKPYRDLLCRALNIDPAIYDVDPGYDRFFGKPGRSRLFESDEPVPQIGERWFGAGDNLFGDGREFVPAAADPAPQPSWQSGRLQEASKPDAKYDHLFSGKTQEAAAVPITKPDPAFDRLFGI